MKSVGEADKLISLQVSSFNVEYAGCGSHRLQLDINVYGIDVAETIADLEEAIKTLKGLA